MKPLNYKERKIGFLQFAFVFGIMILLMFSVGYLTFRTGGLGVDVLEKKHRIYTESFRKKAELNFDIEEIIKRLYQINSKERNLSQHKKYQDLISDIRNKMYESINTEKAAEDYVIYAELIAIVKETQIDLDTYEEDFEKRAIIEDLLERCEEKYIQEQEKKNKQ